MRIFVDFAFYSSVSYQVSGVGNFCAIEERYQTLGQTVFHSLRVERDGVMVGKVMKRFRKGA